ncbi:GGDEF domain-containing protein [Pseudomonas typographi]|uniref:GGDEF domain-containing protein n=1 Tax=Pseudomonas typographi TaxID=2715964 RepID=UPI0016838480|nr:GGDEF domain-containing protein [Pseudomonas typographi]MBD1586875.1 GGDEF domain-containing protein [Pseudomonas typographi]
MDGLRALAPSTSYAGELETLQLMLDASIDCIKLLSTDGRILKINLAGRKALGLIAEPNRINLPWLKLLPQEVRRNGQRALRLATTGKRSSFIGKSELAGQPSIIWENILTPLFSNDGSVMGILCLSRDVSRQAIAEEKLREASLTDLLTSLPNRRAFKLYADSFRKRYLKNNLKTALLIFDVDNFKSINDLYGHDAGDEVLRQIARRLDAGKSGDEYMARLGGDEFVLLAGVKDACELTHVATRMLKDTSSPIDCAGVKVKVGISIGGAILSADQDLSQLMKNSDSAMYAAKQKGKSNYHIHGSVLP